MRPGGSCKHPPNTPTRRRSLNGFLAIFVSCRCVVKGVRRQGMAVATRREAAAVDASIKRATTEIHVWACMCGVGGLHPVFVNRAGRLQIRASPHPIVLTATSLL